MALPRVFVSRLIPEAGLEKLKGLCELDVWTDPLPPPRAVLLEKVRTCAGLLSLLTDKVDAELLAAAPDLKVVSNFAVGYNNIDVPACTKRGIPVGNTPGVLTEATADLAMALLLSTARKVVSSQRYAVEGHWKTWEPRGHIGVDLVGKTVGVVGLGRIGQAFAKRCYGGWGMKVLYNNRRRIPEAEAALAATWVDLPTLLRESDFVSVHADLNDTTKGMFNAAAFAQMKPTAIFINTARGGHVVQADLIAALKAGQIFAAGIDVTEPEPPPADDPLYSAPNLVVLPHIASATVVTRNGMADIAADNLLAGLAGKPLRHCVNPDVQKT